MACGMFAYELDALLRALITAHSVSISFWRQRKKNQCCWHRCFVAIGTQRKVGTLQDLSFRDSFLA